MVQPTSERADLALIRQRLREKVEAYTAYNFTEQQNTILKSFFDLSQEFDSLRDLYRISVAVLLETMGVESALYLLHPERDGLLLVCDSEQGVLTDPQPAPSRVRCSDIVYETGSSLVVPVFQRPPSADAAPARPAALNLFSPANCSWELQAQLLGMFEVKPLEKLSRQEKFFLSKYTNRIGFRLHNRLVARQNIRHLKFINTLVMDIEHNVIIPNMYFRHLFNQLKKKIGELQELQVMMGELQAKRGTSEDPDCQRIMERITILRGDLDDYHKQMQKHHANLSLFLESLFRREHFEKGHLVLQARRCRVVEEIIKPQLEQYLKRLEAQGISIDEPVGMAGEEIPLMVDVGLLAQVYANLFSNAVKYTREIIDHRGLPRKALAYGREILYNHFGQGQQGIKFNVFSTGPHLPADEARIIFSEGTRGSNSPAQFGTGHGLAFVKHVVEIHGGQVGYEPTEEGNNFYFILPLPPMELLPLWSSLGE